MATKIRLQRHGRKRRAIYHIIAADSRAKRDGKFIEKLGLYNPNTNPASIDLDFDRALHWVKVGAEMTDTARSILSYKGVLMKKHLDGGVAKGAFSQDEADKKFAAWLEEKEGQIDAKVKGLADAASKAKEEALAAEAKVKEARAAELASKNAELAEEAEAAVAEEAEEVEAPAEEPAAEEATEAPAEEAPEVEATAEEPVAEEAAPEVEEAPAEEPAAEEAPAEEAEEEKKEESAE